MLPTVPSATTAHEFALYWEHLNVPSYVAAAPLFISISDPALVHRVTKVLRFNRFEKFILFNNLYCAHVVLEGMSSKHIVVNIESFYEVSKLVPTITILLPLLKTDALESALYSMAELGVQKIQLIYTQKVQRKYKGDKEFQRLKNILIAACEQAKYYAVPDLYEPIELIQALDEIHASDTRLYADFNGSNIGVLLQSKPKSLVYLIGPESGLTSAECELLHSKGFVSYTLGPTILRAWQAATVTAGIIRALCNG